MATTTADLQLRLAYRLGENSIPNNSNEKARRLSFLNEAGRDVMRRHYWWFSEATTSFSSVANQESYSTSDGLPTDLRLLLEVRFQDTIYTQLQQSEVLDSFTRPYTNASNSYFMFNGKMYFVPKLASTVSSGITLKYYKNYTNLSADSDETIIPDMFSDVQVAYAAARVNQMASDRGSASDAFDEYNEIMDLMAAEQNKYLFSLKYSAQNDEIPTYI